MNLPVRLPRCVDRRVIRVLDSFQHGSGERLPFLLHVDECARPGERSRGFGAFGNCEFGRDLHHCFDQNGSCGTNAGTPDKCGIARLLACFRNVDAGLEAAGADIWAIDLQMDKDLRSNTPRKVGAKLTFRGNFRIRVGIRRLLGRSNPKQFRTRR